MRLAILCAALVIAASGLTAQVRAAKRATSDPESGAKINLNEVLERRFDFSFQNVPLKEVVDYLSNVTNVTFYISQKKLEEASVSPDTPINSTFRNIRLRTWLDLTLKELELDYIQKDDLIVITTPEDVESSLVIRVYDCRDLLDLAKRQRIETPTTGKTPSPIESDRATNYTAMGCGSVVPKRPIAQTDDERRAERLLHVVETSVATHTWERVGGPGTVCEYVGTIVVTQTEHAHLQVERLLDMLREAAGLEVPKTGKVVR